MNVVKQENQLADQKLIAELRGEVEAEKARTAKLSEVEAQLAGGLYLRSFFSRTVHGYLLSIHRRQQAR